MNFKLDKMIAKYIAPSKGAAIEKAEQVILSRAGVKSLHSVSVKDITGQRCGCGETPAISMNAWSSEGIRYPNGFHYAVVAICPNCSDEGDTFLDLMKPE